MINWGPQAEGDKNFSLWLWDDERVSATEYKRSLQNLQRFVAEVDVSKLATLEDVSAVTSLVGHDICTGVKSCTL